jgi:Fe-S-cluster-containing hydrogenase component 2
VLEIVLDDYDDSVAAVAEDHRKKIKYSCAPCKPDRDRAPLPCLEACTPGAITHSW